MLSDIETAIGMGSELIDRIGKLRATVESLGTHRDIAPLRTR